MPDRPLTIATYAAGASLAAITLVYVFGPALLTDSEHALSGRNNRKKGVVGLRNSANDCFINAVLQTLAGIPDLRLFLVRELYTRSRVGAELYSQLPEKDKPSVLDPEKSGSENASRQPPIPPRIQVSQQQGTVTKALKEVLDSLNERPAARKTISANGFIAALERAFDTGLNRTQQDAQEFLQLVTERLSDEYHAGERVRKEARAITPKDDEVKETSKDIRGKQESENATSKDQEASADEGLTGFPMEGKLESTVNCTQCFFGPKPTTSTFTTLTLHVPQNSASTTLDACFDGSFMLEHLDDYCCDRCYLNYALESKWKELTDGSGRKVHEVEAAIFDLEAYQNDPENLSRNLDLPPLQSAPKQRVARSSKISAFPQVLAIHLSRSVWSSSSTSTKNQARVSFTEYIKLGPLMQRVHYRLLALITHQGAHNSGHYESFRRQNQQRETDAETADRSNHVRHEDRRKTASGHGSTVPSIVIEDTDRPSQINSKVAAVNVEGPVLEERTLEEIAQFKRNRSEQKGSQSSTATSTNDNVARLKEHLTSRIDRRTTKRQQDRWWRISDDKIRECSTRDALSMQKEVYLLFYERVFEQ